MMTSPCACASRAIAGYTGVTLTMRCGARTTPPTRTGGVAGGAGGATTGPIDATGDPPVRSMSETARLPVVIAASPPVSLVTPDGGISGAVSMGVVATVDDEPSGAV